ncbi:MAG TPA: uroporphyrinogen-III C-methyltransferase [Acidimicrobiales bacterium]|nr:uroporphyrinogen-III C-methyltransferase [Acidimicrobiales bacterium]
MTVYLVGAGPGDPGLLTLRGAALLARADVVLHDRLVSLALLDLVPTSALVIDVGKDPDGPVGGAGRQQEIARLLVEHGRASAVVVRLKGGDPFLFGRGGEEVEALARAGLAWEVVPGVTSAFGVPAAVGIPVTQRGVAASVTVVTGRVGDADGTSEHDWEALGRVGGTLVILMGMATRAAIAAALVKGGRAPDTAVAVIARGTTASQRVTRTTLAGLADVDLGPPAVIVVGPVAALGQYDADADADTDRPLAGRTVVVTRSGERGRGLVDALERAGATTVELPLTRQVEPADGGAALHAAAAAVLDNTWVVLTSVNAADRFMGALRDARALGSVLVAAVGPATADALRRCGVEPDLVPAEHSARGLVEEFPDAASAGSRRVVFPSADLAPETIPEGLGQKGWDVRRVEAYRTVPRAAPEPALLEKVAAADALTFAATSTVQAFLALRTAAGNPVQPPPHVVCIGPTTAAAARAAGLEGVHEAWGASAQGIVDELIGELGPGGRDGP